VPKRKVQTLLEKARAAPKGRARTAPTPEEIELLVVYLRGDISAVQFASALEMGRMAAYYAALRMLKRAVQSGYISLVITAKRDHA
jgi:hypothetical protein